MAYCGPYAGIVYRSEGFAFTGYDIPGCVEDGAWMLWENSSVVVVAAVVVVAVAHPGLEKLLVFYYGIGPTHEFHYLFLVGKNQI